MQEFSNVPYELEIVNLGSTFAKHGFDYQLFGKRGFNFAGQPQPLKDDYAILSRYQDHLRPGAVVIVVVCPFGFSRYEYADQRPGLAERVLRKTKSAVKTVIGYDRAKRSKYEKLSVEEKSRSAAASRVNDWKEEFSLSDTTDERPSEEMRRIFSKTRNELKDILLLCQEKGFRPVVINMPAARAEYTLFSERFMQEFYEENLSAANVIGAPVFHYFGDERFDDPLLYENYADCFNDAGRRKFAEILIQDLKAISFWPL